MLLTTFVHAGDTQSNAQRGYYFSSFASVPTGSVAYAWRYSMNSITTPGGLCYNLAGTMSNGGQLGMNGCGGNKSTAIGFSLANAYARLNGNWNEIKDNTRDATSNAYVLEQHNSNWDEVTYPMSFP